MTKALSGSELPDFSDESVRRRLGPASLDLFTRIMSAWKISGEDAGRLLGLSPGAGIKQLTPERVSEDQLLRISYLLGIYKALHSVFGEALADEWVSLPNRNAMFCGESPLMYMTRNGIDALQQVRKLLDARAAGH